jgi:hypothetical protein
VSDGVDRTPHIGELRMLAPIELLVEPDLECYRTSEQLTTEPLMHDHLTASRLVLKVQIILSSFVCVSAIPEIGICPPCANG